MLSQVILSTYFRTFIFLSQTHLSLTAAVSLTTSPQTEQAPRPYMDQPHPAWDNIQNNQSPPIDEQHLICQAAPLDYQDSMPNNTKTCASCLTSEDPCACVSSLLPLQQINKMLVPRAKEQAHTSRRIFGNHQKVKRRLPAPILR